MSLSRKNGMVDEEKRVYIYFSIEEVMEVLSSTGKIEYTKEGREIIIY